MSFRGLGRGKGFEVSEEFSVLGDDEYSPVVAERVLALCKMFLDEEIINSEHVLGILELKSATATSGEFPILMLPQVVNLPSASSGSELERAREMIEEKEKELARKRMIDKELLKIMKYYPYAEINEEEEPWTIEITDFDKECRLYLLFFYDKLSLDTQKRL